VIIEEKMRCHLGYLDPGAYVIVEVRDRGPGISAEVLDRVFEPFFSSKQRSNGSGSGLGLSIVSAVMHDHNGVLDLLTGSEGTTFRLYIPCLHSEPVNEGKPRDTLKVLIVGRNNPALQTILRELLGSGHSAKQMLSAHDARITVRDDALDCVIIDFDDPELGSDEFLLSLREIKPYLNFIVLTSTPRIYTDSPLSLVANVLPRAFETSQLYEALRSKHPATSRAA
jgi:hypothetical protein